MNNQPSAASPVPAASAEVVSGLDPKLLAKPLAPAEVPVLKELYRQMLVIRRVEEAAAKVFSWSNRDAILALPSRQKIRGTA
jgi:hypothetical protein